MSAHSWREAPKGGGLGAVPLDQFHLPAACGRCCRCAVDPRCPFDHRVVLSLCLQLWHLQSRVGMQFESERAAPGALLKPYVGSWSLELAWCMICASFLTAACFVGGPLAPSLIGNTADSLL
jgi:hypothetical protein